jgi:hypothetical protein
MNRPFRLLSLAILASACAVAQSTPSEAASVAADTSVAQPNLQPRSQESRELLPTATELRLKLDHPISTATAKAGDRFTATLVRPVEAQGNVVIAAGTKVSCRIDRARGMSRLRGRPVLILRATGARDTSGEELDFIASVVDTGNPRKLDVDDEGRIRGSSPNPMNKVEVGALTGAGMVTGAVIAGPEGLLIGGAAGAVTATGHILGKHRDLTLPSGTELIFELDSPATLAHGHMAGMN